MENFKALDQLKLMQSNAKDNEILRKDESESLMNNSSLNNHIYDDNIHISTEERERWNNKMDKLAEFITPIDTPTLLKISFNSSGLITKSSPATINDIPKIPIENIKGLQEELDKSYELPDTSKYVHYMKDQTFLTDYLEELKLRITSDYFSESLSSNSTYEIFFYDESYEGEESPITIIPDNTFKLNDKALVFWHKNPNVVYIGTYAAEGTWTWITEPTTNLFRDGYRVAFKHHITVANASTPVTENDLSKINGYAIFKHVGIVPDFEIIDTLTNSYEHQYTFGKIASAENDGLVPKDYIKSFNEKEVILDNVSSGIGALPAYDFGTLEPTQEDLNNYLATLQKDGYKITPKKGMFVRNLYNGSNHQWMYTEDGTWINTGSGIIGYATDISLGIGKMGTDPANFTMDTDPNSLTYQGIKLNAYDTILSKADNKLTEANVIPENHLISLNDNDEVVDLGITANILFAKPETFTENNLAIYDENGMIVDSLKGDVDFTVASNPSLGFLSIPFNTITDNKITDPIFESIVPKDGKVIGIPMLYSIIENDWMFGMMNVYYSHEHSRYEFFGLMVNVNNVDWNNCYFVKYVDYDDRVYAYPYTVSSYNGEYTYKSDTQEISTFIPDHYLRLQLWNNKIIYAETMEDLNACCQTTDEWQRVTFASGETFIKNDVKSVKFGNIWDLDTIPDHFLYHFGNLRTINPLPRSVTKIGIDFLGGCSKFNAPITLTQNITSIGASYLFNCYSYNQNVIIPNTITTIEGYFMSNCTSFNSSISIPSTVLHIKNGFMINCTSFNKPLTLPNNLTIIGNSFMDGCSAFNQNLVIPNSLASIGTNFMPDCRSLNHLTVSSNFLTIMQTNHETWDENDKTLTVDITSSAAYRAGLMLHGMSESDMQIINTILPNRIASDEITNKFRRIVTNNPVLTLNAVNGYVYYAAHLDDIIAISNSSPASATVIMSDGLSFKKNRIDRVEFNKGWNSISIPNYFLRNFDNLIMLSNKADDEPISNIFPNMITSIGDYFLSGCKLYNQNEFTLPSRIIEIKNYFMSGCTQFNRDIIIPETVTKIGSYFLNACNFFKSKLTIPESVTEIGEYFMTACTAITEIVIPATITKIGEGFFANAKSLVKLTAAPSVLDALSDDIWTLSTSVKTDVMYLVGVSFNVEFSDEQKTSLHEKLPDRNTEAPFRKLITL